MTWACSARAASRAPDVERGPAADTGVDLVEDERGRHRRLAAPAEHHLEREHDPRQLAAGGGPGHAARGGTRVGREQDLDVVDAVAATSRTPLAVGQRHAVGVGRAGASATWTTALPMARCASSSETRLPKSSPAARRASDSASAAPPSVASSSATSAPSRSTRSSAVTSRRAEPRRVRDQLEHLVDGLAVLAREDAEGGPPLLHEAEPGRGRGRVLEVCREVGREVGRRGCRPRAAARRARRGPGRGRSPASRRAARRPDEVARRSEPARRHTSSPLRSASACAAARRRVSACASRSSSARSAASSPGWGSTASISSSEAVSESISRARSRASETSRACSRAESRQRS